MAILLIRGSPWCRQNSFLFLMWKPVNYLFSVCIVFFKVLGTECAGLAWDGVDILHSRSYSTLFWVCDQNSVDSTPMF